jgi:adenosylmethionine---8-amino-7-oxononanoate aminotransferase
VAIASLEQLLEEETQKCIKTIENAHQIGIQMLMDNFGKEGIITKGRHRGTVSAINLAKELLGTDEQRRNFKRKMLKEGLLLRPLGQTVYLLPPYCTKHSELEIAYQKIAEYIDKNKQ